MAGAAIWFGIVVALLLCFATAIAYAELSKLYPGAGSSYFFAEQAFLSKTNAYKFARISKFVIGWASHLYYWVYPGVMVGVTAILAGWLASKFRPNIFNGSINSPTFMIGFCVFFAFGVSYIAYRGVNGSTGVNVAVNVIQISALLVFSVIALGYRVSHTEGSAGWTLDQDGNPVNVVLAADKDGKPIPDGKGGYKAEQENGKDKPFILSYKGAGVAPQPVDAAKPNGDKQDTFMYHESAASVVAPHSFNYMFIQACIAILILVGFESVTSLGEEAKNAKRDIPRAVLLSLFIQGVVCYLIEYFCAGYFQNPGYTVPQAASSSAPIGDMMVLAGTWLFGSPTAGWWFMMIEAITVFLALIGTTLSCINTGARVTYAMGRDDEVPSHFGMLHGRNLTPHRAIWTLAVVSMVLGIFTVIFYLCGPAASAALDTSLSDAPEDQLLVSQVPGLLQQPGGRTAQQSADRDPGEQLRHLHALRAHLRGRHRGLPRAPYFQRDQALRNPDLRRVGQPGLHGVLPGRTVHRLRHEQDGALHRLGGRRRLGRLWAGLLHVGRQEEGPHGLGD